MDYIYIWDRRNRPWYIDVSNLNLDGLYTLKKELGNYCEGATNMIDKIIIMRTLTRQEARIWSRKQYNDLDKNKCKKKVRRK